jgi:hypothetical protein
VAHCANRDRLRPAGDTGIAGVRKFIAAEAVRLRKQVEISGAKMD